MAFDTVPSMLFMSAASCILFGYMQKPVCKTSGGFEDECGGIAELGFPAAGILASSAMMLCCLTHMGMLGRGSMMGAYGGGGYGGGYGMY